MPIEIKVILGAYLLIAVLMGLRSLKGRIRRLA